MLPESRERGYKAGRFSFNVKGGRCEACQGDGMKRIEMNFLPDVYVTCDVCRGKRYNQETLQVKYKNHSIADLLEATVEEALPTPRKSPADSGEDRTLNDVGLGYIHLGQSATTLSGGEAQRIKLAKELSRRQTGKTFYILDEPTTGLHFDDVRKLLDVLHQAGRLGQHRACDRASSGCDQDGRLDHRSRSGRRRRRRRACRVRHAGAGDPQSQEPHGTGAEKVMRNGKVA